MAALKYSIEKAGGTRSSLDGFVRCRAMRLCLDQMDPFPLGTLAPRHDPRIQSKRSSIATCDQGPRRESAGQCRASSGGRWGKEAAACPGFRGGLIGRVNKCSIPSKLFCCCFAKSCVGTPANIIARLNTAIVEALADPAVSRASSTLRKTFRHANGRRPTVACFSRSRNREVVADYQGGQHQGGMNLLQCINSR